jgi:hypothetical protein
MLLLSGSAPLFTALVQRSGIVVIGVLQFVNIALIGVGEF